MLCYILNRANFIVVASMWIIVYEFARMCTLLLALAQIIKVHGLGDYDYCYCYYYYYNGVSLHNVKIAAHCTSTGETCKSAG